MDDEYLQLLRDRESLLQCKYAFDLLTHNYFEPIPTTHLPPSRAQRYYLMFLKTWVDGTVDLFRTTSRYLHYFRFQGEMLLFLAEHHDRLQRFELAVREWKYPFPQVETDFVIHAKNHLDGLLRICRQELERRAAGGPVVRLKSRVQCELPPLSPPSPPPPVVPSRLRRYANVISTSLSFTP